MNLLIYWKILCGCDVNLKSIDLRFMSQLNLVEESGVHPSLHPNCHHQIVFAKFSLISYSPPYAREVWHYRKANIDLIRRAISNFNWEKHFYNTIVNKKVSVFNETILNVLSNYITHETLTCDAMFRLLFETHFAINMLSSARLLVCCLWKFFCKNWEIFFVFCNVILSISNTLFGNSIQWINKTWISLGYNVEKYNVDELNSSEKNCFAFFS